MAKTWDIAVVGAASAVGAAILEQLLARDFALGHVFALDGESAAGGTVAFGHRELRVAAVERFDFATVQLAFFAGDTELAARFAPTAASAGAVVIELSGQFADDPEVPLVVPEVNGEALAQFTGRRIVALPSPAATALALVLQPLHRAAGVAQVNVVSLHPVSEAGPGAVEELGRQTADLLSFRTPRREVFAQQIAFNLLPVVGEPQSDGASLEEHRIARETARLLGERAPAINATALRVPVFYGVSLAIQLQTCDKLAPEAACALLRDVTGIELMDESGEGTSPTPVGEASGDDAVHVGRVREDRSQPRGLNLWAVTDNLRKGSALNAVQIAELLVRDYL